MEVNQRSKIDRIQLEFLARKQGIPIFGHFHEIFGHFHEFTVISSFAIREPPAVHDPVVMSSDVHAKWSRSSPAPIFSGSGKTGCRIKRRPANRPEIL